MDGGIKINKTCPNMPKRKATGWSKFFFNRWKTNANAC